jgi:hypothetical protein
LGEEHQRVKRSIGERTKAKMGSDLYGKKWFDYQNGRICNVRNGGLTAKTNKVNT